MFTLQQRLVVDFRNFIESFLLVRDPAIKDFLIGELDRGALWPSPLLQLNPSFEPGPRVDDLVENGILEPKCGAIFRKDKSEKAPIGKSLTLYRHQVRAAECAKAGRNFVLTTGTGSGKSLCYILPIVDAILREGSGKGIRAVVVYPMNALANSQLGELEKYLGPRASKPLVTYARYTGQESNDEREEVVTNPPDILLTNFMMLELILTRPYERPLVKSMENLRFMVLDELHTYRGRQGADVALLVRRLREQCKAQKVQYIGTSATMATEGLAADRRRQVADVASNLFGADVSPDDVIGETLQRFAAKRDLASEAFRAELRASLDAPLPADLEGYRNHPLSSWLEGVVGLETDDEGTLVRGKPMPLCGPESVSNRLAAQLGLSEDHALKCIQRHLQWKPPADHEYKGCPVVFRLHQFFSPGNGIFATLGSGEERFFSTDGMKSAPDDPGRALLPLCFCRACGQHYYIVRQTVAEDGRTVYVPRELRDAATSENDQPGFLYVPPPGVQVDLNELIPEDWFERGGSGKLLKEKRDLKPTLITIDPSGYATGEISAWFISQGLPFCMNKECGISYEPRESIIQKLSVLGMQGRSTATTTLAISSLHHLRGIAELPDTARKILSFTDNRQDASLQAGHLNDFVQVGLVRAALCAAVRTAGESGLSHDQVALAVEKQLALLQEEYAAQPTDLPKQIEQRLKALRDVLGYRIYVDLRRGWRVNFPNLEQVGLVRIEYPDLALICSGEKYWQGKHGALVAASPETRETICRELLDRMRRNLTINVDYLNAEYQEGMRQRSSQLLKEPWGLSSDESSNLRQASLAWLETTEASRDKGDLRLTPQGAFCRYLSKRSTWPNCDTQLNSKEAAAVAKDLIRVLVDTGMVREVPQGKGLTAYQLNAEVFVWLPADPAKREGAPRNTFFEHLYTEGAHRLRSVSAREHTAQVDSETRIRREKEFREGALPILFCSPTMELGVDIADLNVVNLRNVPPTPANYAQRSGRAGRSGQPALVYTYCTNGSQHDQHYFRRPEDMVAGAVAPPRIEIVNEDLIRAHVHALWLAEANISLESSMADRVLDVAGDNPTLALQQEIRDRLQDKSIRTRVASAARSLLEPLRDELEKSVWYTDRWLEDVIDQIPLSFESACERWRNLYRAARKQSQDSYKRSIDHSLSRAEQEAAQRLLQEAQHQMNLLVGSKDTSSDFYVYRYLASEGFLPGYNFPRLPISAYLPQRRNGGGNQYLSRARFLAIAEFGPGAIIYHEGSRYLVARVMLGSSRSDSGGLSTLAAKLCGKCGAVHLGEQNVTTDLCEWCNTPLSGDDHLQDLLRLEGVSLRRRDRITCDEEERMRQGYDIRTGLRILGPGGKPQCLSAEAVSPDGHLLARLTYAPAATIVRINLGWRKRRQDARPGFLLDLDKGRWLNEEGANELMKEFGEVEGAKRVHRVIPYVEDRRNALLLEWTGELTDEEHASVQAALKSAIQTVYQLEESELAAEPLPSESERRSILFYEAAEGGAGVLHHLATNPGALRRVAMEALAICHYHPETLEDQRKHPRAREECSVACYDCLLSYYNQRDHLLLDRRQARDWLAALRDTVVTASPAPKSRSQHLEELMKRCESELERKWLTFLEQRKLNLPSHAQYRIAECNCRPDFAYLQGGTRLAVYVDGPVHAYKERQARDAEQTACLESLGWIVQRFRVDDTWEDLVREFPSVYGVLS